MTIKEDMIVKMQHAEHQKDARTNVVAMRLSDQAAAEYHRIGGAVLINKLLLTKCLPTIKEVREINNVHVPEKSRFKSDTAPHKMTVKEYVSSSLYEWGSAQHQSVKRQTLGMLRRRFTTKGLVNVAVIKESLILATPSIIENFGAKKMFSACREGEVIEPWVYVGMDCFIRLYQLLYLLNSPTVNELPDNVFYKDDIRVPIVPVLPFNGDFASDIVLDKGGVLKVSTVVPEKYRADLPDGSNIVTDLFGSYRALDANSLVCTPETFSDLHSDVPYSDFLSLMKDAQKIVQTLWSTRVSKPISLETMATVGSIINRVSVKTSSWVAQYRLKNSRERQYVGSFQYVNEAIYALMQYRLMTDIMDENDIVASQFEVSKKTPDSMQSFLMQWVKKYTASQQVLRECLFENSEYKEYLRSPVVRHKHENIDEEMLSIRKEEFSRGDMDFAMRESNRLSNVYEDLKDIVFYEFISDSYSADKPFFDEKLYHLELQGVSLDYISTVAKSCLEGSQGELPRLFKEFSFKEAPID